MTHPTSEQLALWRYRGDDRPPCEDLFVDIGISRRSGLMVRREPATHACPERDAVQLDPRPAG